MTDLQTALAAVGCKNDPRSVVRLLRALARSDVMKANHHDTILVGAAEMIEAFERILEIEK